MSLLGVSLTTLTAKLRALDTLLARAPVGNVSNDASGAIAATVVGRASDGRLVVTVDDASFAVQYEGDAAAGDIVQLPARLVAEARTELANQNAARGESATEPHFTPAARLLSTLPVAREALVRVAQPLAANAAAPHHIAAGLKETVDASGLFYESHVADWARGERTLGTLAQEPQMRWMHGENSAPARDVAMAGGAQPVPSPGMDPGMSQTSTAMGNQAVPAHAAEVPAALRELVGQQLALQDARRIAWEGEAWPGQSVRLAIEADEEHALGEDAPRNWRVTLATELPHLGRIEAEIQLAGERASVRLQALSSDAAAQLTSHAESFHAALTAAGVPLTALMVKHDG
jgi:Flagellar hook-length control protein FliK